jgi:hypothetical protein
MHNRRRRPWEWSDHTLVDIITAQDFRLASCQATLFTPDEEVSSIKLIRGLLPKWTERFDAEPPSMPVADGLPRETPRLILESQSHVWRCQIASARIDLFWRKTIVDPSDITLDEFFRVAIQLLNEYQEFLGARVARIAAVLNRYAEHPTPGPFVAWHFCQERWFPPSHTDIESCELHVHKRFVLAEQFQVNLWVRSKTNALSSA